jgi:O-antigen/teichoic acid export membrane protein
MAYLMVAGNTVVGALGQAATPRLARYYAAGDQEAFLKLLRQLGVIGVALGGAGVVIALGAGHTLLSLLYGPAYGARSDVFVWIAMAGGVGYLASILGYAMMAARYFAVQLPLFLVCDLATVAACAVLVPKYHLLGAAGALVITAFCQVAGALCVVGYALGKQRIEVQA